MWSCLSAVSLLTIITENVAFFCCCCAVSVVTIITAEKRPSAETENVALPFCRVTSDYNN